MRPPKDSEDFAAHVIQSDGAIRIYCVECERWTEVIVMATATVTYHQNQWWNGTEDAQQPGYHCKTRNCEADIGYLLSETQKDYILKLAGVPIAKKATQAPAQSLVRLERQMRLL